VPVVDLQPLYPPHLIPGWMLGITEYYIKTFNDQYFINEPVWFHFFMMSELFIQVPVMIWGIGALRRGMSFPIHFLSIDISLRLVWM
jgi:hypothetical protein